MSSYLVTGASRGLGLAYVQNLAALPASDASVIFATTRGDSAALTSLAQESGGRVRVITLNVTDKASIKQAAVEVESQLPGAGLDILINNAGACNWNMRRVEEMDDLEESFQINVFGVHWVTQAFLPLMRKGKGKKIVNMSTAMASITEASLAAFAAIPSYKISKAAMNALTKQYALDLEKDGFVVFALSPGWLKTELGGGDAAPLTADQGAKASLDIIFKAGPEQNGTFPSALVQGFEDAKPYPYNGESFPW